MFDWEQIRYIDLGLTGIEFGSSIYHLEGGHNALEITWESPGEHLKNS